MKETNLGVGLNLLVISTCVDMQMYKISVLGYDAYPFTHRQMCTYTSVITVALIFVVFK